MTIQGRITSIRFRNEQNGWTAFNVMCGQNSLTETLHAVTGIAPPLRKDMTVRIEGTLADTKYGPTIKATSITEVRPSDTEGIYKYLASGLIKNIGPVFARAIVDTFGEDTLTVLDNQPERLAEVKGIGPKRIGSVIEAVKEQKAVRSIMIWLKRYDLPNGLAAKIYKAYGDASVARLEENPYRLADDIKGVGFKKSDAVARLLGLPADSTYRILSGLRAFLEDRAAEGHTCMPFEETVTRTASEEYLDIPEEKVRRTAESGEFMQVGTVEDGMAFLPLYLHAEDTIAERLSAILRHGRRDPDGEPDFEAIEKKSGISFSATQRDAVRLADASPVMILTGGPGTGKTTTTNGIIAELESRDMKVVLCAPTGRAAKRMTESTRRPSRTIHRLLEFRQGRFVHDEDNPLEGDAFIVDEASMIDTVLMKHLLKAVPDRAKLIIVGDIDQLPSVGAGSVLRDLIGSGAVPTVHLTEIYRQAQGSDIIMNAHRVNKGTYPYFRPKGEPTDFRFVEEEDKDAIAEKIVRLVRSDIPRKLGFTPEDIQVLTPMRRDWDPIGAVRLNAALQDALNRGGTRVAGKGGTEFRTGDRIMQTRNNYDKDIFNGDTGKVTGKAAPDPELDDKAVMEAEFDGRIVRLSQEDLDDIELAYACTVHKSQGSEYPCVVMPIHSSQYVMLKRNLLYTGITRARKQCIIIGNRKGINAAVWHEDTSVRNTRLRQKVQAAAGGCNDGFLLW